MANACSFLSVSQLLTQYVPQACGLCSRQTDSDPRIPIAYLCLASTARKVSRIEPASSSRSTTGARPELIPMSFTLAGYAVRPARRWRQLRSPLARSASRISGGEW